MITFMGADKCFQLVDTVQMEMEGNTLAGIKREALSVGIHIIHGILSMASV
jgi:hypothetical protein